MVPNAIALLLNPFVLTVATFFWSDFTKRFMKPKCPERRGIGHFSFLKEFGFVRVRASHSSLVVAPSGSGADQSENAITHERNSNPT